MSKILVTDSLFITDQDMQHMRDAGYEVERLDKPEASEDELCEIVKDKVGYILGGTEKVTQRVIDAGADLKAIVFCGIGYKGFIPAWKYATEKGIAIGNVPDGPTNAVAEWSIAAALMMNRGFLELGSNFGEKSFMTTKGLEGLDIGIIALGRIGSRIAEMLQVFHPGKVQYFSTHRHEDQEQSLGLTHEPDMYKLLGSSDVVFLCVPDDAGHPFFTDKEFAVMKQGSLLVSFMHTGIIGPDSLYSALEAGKIRAVSDYPMDERFVTLPVSKWYSFNASNAFNTDRELSYTSEEAVKTLLNLLQTGDDGNLVNPECRQRSK